MKHLLGRFWLWRTNKLWTWVESTLITLLILLFCYLFNPSNPLYFHEIFPWPWLAGIIVVLQYGFGPGMLSVFIILVAVLQFQSLGGLSVVDFQNYILSGMTLLLTCAMFSASWLRRMLNAEELLVYTNERLNSLSRSYYMLRISYDYLEQNVITKPYTLRMVLENLQLKSVAEQGEITNEIAYRFLQVVAQYCSINSLAMYLYNKKKLETQAIAEIGPVGILDLDDPLIRQSMEKRDICYVSVNQFKDANECQYLVSIPMQTSDGLCLGFIVIKDISFWTINNETLTILSILTSYFIEEVSFSKNDLLFLKAYPHCPSDFAKQLNKLTYLKHKLSVDSSLCAVLVSKDLEAFSVIDNLKRERRFINSIWELSVGDESILITLLPFTNSTGVYGFVTRITNFLTSTLGLSYTPEQIKIRTMQIDHQDPLKVMEKFIQFIGKNSFDD